MGVGEGGGEERERAVEHINWWWLCPHVWGLKGRFEKSFPACAQINSTVGHTPQMAMDELSLTSFRRALFHDRFPQYARELKLWPSSGRSRALAMPTELCSPADQLFLLNNHQRRIALHALCSPSSDNHTKLEFDLEKNLLK